MPIKKHDKYLNERGCRIAYILAKAGYPMKQIAAGFQVSRRTFCYWRKRYEPMQKAVEAGREAVAREIEEILTLLQIKNSKK